MYVNVGEDGVEIGLLEDWIRGRPPGQRPAARAEPTTGRPFSDGRTVVRARDRQLGSLVSELPPGPAQMRSIPDHELPGPNRAG